MLFCLPLSSKQQKEKEKIIKRRKQNFPRHLRRPIPQKPPTMFSSFLYAHDAEMPPRRDVSVCAFCTEKRLVFHPFFG